MSSPEPAIPPREALADVRVRAPTRGNRKLELLLDADAFDRVLSLLAAERATEVARRFELDADRVRLLSAGLLILQAAAERFGAPLEVGRGGLREGLLLEVADA